MKKKAIGAITVSIIAIIGALILNFQEFLMGSVATVKNLSVTVLYMAVWIFILRVGIKNKNRMIMKYCFVFWIVMIFLSILVGFTNITEISIDWALPFVILLMGQWYGIRFFVGSFLSISSVILFISLLMTTSVAISLKRIK